MKIAKRSKHKKWLAYGLLGVIGTISIASASVPSRITDDTALYQNLSEIRARKQADLNFDGDVARLSKMESRYREPLPKVERLSTPMKRISQKHYAPTTRSRSLRR